MSYARPPFPRQLFKRFNRVAKLLGYLKIGTRWKLFDLLLAYAEAHPDLFRSR